jgi:thioredoxin reductase
MKIIIIGAGPNGISAYISLSNIFKKAEIVILEKKSSLSNLRDLPDVVWHSSMKTLKLKNSVLNEYINDDYRPITSELITYYEQIIFENGIKIIENSNVVKIENLNECVKVSYLKNAELEYQLADYVIVTSGIFENKRGIDYQFKKIDVKNNYNQSIRNKTFLLIGAGNSSVDFIINMLPFNRIYWIIKGNQLSHIFSNTKDEFDKVCEKFKINLEIYFNDFVVDEPNLNEVLLKSGKTINSIDQVIILTGYNSKAQFLEKSGIAFDGESIDSDDNYETNLKNVYVFGSLSAKNISGKLQPTFVSNGNHDIMKKIIQSILYKSNQNLNSTTFFIDYPYVSKLLIICHPDDEILWGWHLLKTYADIHVICLTDGNSEIRKKKFISVMKLYQCSFSIFNFEDRGVLGFSLDDIKKIQNILKPIVNSSRIEKIYTHNSRGEYGHPAHSAVNYILSKIVFELDKLFVFTFNNKEFEIDSKTSKAVNIYYYKLNLFELIKNLISITVKSLKLLLNFKLPVFIDYIFFVRYGRTKFDEIMVSSHLHAMKHVDYISYKNYDEVSDLGFDFHKLLFKTPKSSSEVLNNSKDLYELYKDREYLVNSFLSCSKGSVLSVGCHTYNKFDHLFLEEPRNYYTIDINPSYRVYGSPYNHYIGDFLNFNFNRFFDSIILFGVLGIPTSGFGDEYTMYNFEDKAIMKADSLLGQGGKLLLGPDISLDKNISKEQKIIFWEKKIVSLGLLNKYKLIDKLIFPNNMILVLIKK